MTGKSFNVVPSALRFAAFAALMFACLQMTGCNGIQKKHENPVMADATRRVDEETPEESDELYAEKDGEGKSRREDEGDNFEKVRYELTKSPWDGWKDDTTIFNSQVAATVNGVPILNGDVLDRYAGWLISIRSDMEKTASDPKMKGQPVPTPDDYEKLRYQVIARELPRYIQKKVLVERLKSGMKAEQLKAMESHIDEVFEIEIAKLKQDLKVNNKVELEIALNKKGTTLKNIRDNFALDRLSQECFHLKSEKPKRIERPDLVAYYQSHPDDFTVTAQVKWEQIQISCNPSLDKKAAKKKMQQAIAEIKRGIPFDTVAKKYSDGPTAKDGGVWDWMEAGNLVDTKLEKMLFEMPTKVLSEIHEGPDSVCVVRVTERQEAGRKPFKDVQQEIYKLIESEQNKVREQKLMRKIFANIVIESAYEIPRFYSDE